LSVGTVPANVLTLTWRFQGQERMKCITWLTMGARGWFTAELFALIHRPEHFVRIPALAASAGILAATARILIARGLFGLRFQRPSWQDLQEQARLGWHVFLSKVAINGYTASPTLAVGLFGRPLAAGYNSVAKRLAQIYQTFPLPIVLQAMYRRLAKLHAADQRRSLHLMGKAQNVTTALYLLTCLFVALVAPLAVRIVSGKPVREMEIAFAVIALAIVAINANAFRIQCLLVSGRHALFSRNHVSMGLAGSALVFLCACLFSCMGPPAALIAISVAFLVVTMRVVAGIRRREGLA
jgi:O-antigen/teichoic acid export membrane protein